MEALTSVTKALDVHEERASSHARRAGAYAARLAKEMNMDKDAMDSVNRCGFLHDIGKIGIPDDIFRKPSSLTQQERDVVETHVQIGYAMLLNFPLLGDEAEVAHSHHERFDGSGYPQGLKGEAIPLTARIVAVADVFDALRNDRPYRAGLPLEEAVATITAGESAQFDPDVVRAFDACCATLEETSANA